MKRRVMFIAVVLFSAFFSLSSSGLATPSVVRAAGCTTSYGFAFGAFNSGTYVYPTVPVTVPFSPGDTISATWFSGSLSLLPQERWS